MYTVNKAIAITLRDHHRSTDYTAKSIKNKLQQFTSCSKSGAGLLPCSRQADIGMRSHRLLRPDDNMQVCCKLSTGLMQVDC